MPAANRAVSLERPVFLYDGDRALCTRCAEFIERRIPTSARVVPWQWVDLAPLDVTEAQAEASVQWIGREGAVAAGPEAVARLLVEAGGLWRPLGWVDIGPVRWLAWSESLHSTARSHFSCSGHRNHVCTGYGRRVQPRLGSWCRAAGP